MKLPKRSFLLLCQFSILALLASMRLDAAIIEKITIVAEGQPSAVNQQALEDRVNHLIRTTVNREFSDKVLNDDIKVLMKSGSFDDVKVERTTLDNGHISLNIIVKPKPVVMGMLIKGNSKYKDKRLLAKVTLEKDKPLDERKLAESRKAILDKYHEAGYYGTEVTTIQTKTPKGDGVIVTFVINEHPRCKLKGVSFSGNTVFPEDELKHAIVTQRQWWRYIFRFGNYYNEFQHDLDREALRKLYHNKGYLDFEVLSIETTKLDEGKWVSVLFKLQEGTPYKVSSVSLTGSERFTAEELLAATRLKAGDTYNADQESLDTDIMKSKYELLGYIDLRLYPHHEKDETNHEVAIQYRVSEGGVSRIRDLLITGNEYTQEHVIRREMAIHSDDLGDNSKIRLSKNVLMNLGYFERVDILPAVTENPAQRDLRIEVTEKPTGQVSIGAGFSTEDSAIGFIEFNETNFDVRKLMGLEWPPKGGGQRFRARLQAGSEVSNATISLTEPWFLDRRLELTTDLFLQNRFENEYDQRNIGIQSMLSWPISFKIPFTDHKEYLRMGVGLRFEFVKIDDVEHDERDFANLSDDYLERWYHNDDTVRGHNIFDDEDDFWANRVIWRLTRDTRNTFRFPSRGTLLTLQTEYVTQALGSYDDYAKIELSGAHYLPAFRDVIMKTSAHFGTATGEKAAIFDRYFAGGIGTMRGFKRRDVAPVDAFDDPLGGNTLLTTSLEFMKPVKDFMYFCVFVDAGSVWWESFEIDASNFNVSTGIGVQFKALPVNMYYGYPIHTGYDHLDGRSGRFHFSIGYTF